MIGHNLRSYVDYRDRLDVDAALTALEREACRLEIAGQKERAEAFKLVIDWMRK
jgi:hypothetical protein